MDTVSYPLDKLVRRYTRFNTVGDAMEARVELIIDCTPSPCRTSWDRFQREFLADCLDNLYVLRGARENSGLFQRVKRYHERTKEINPVAVIKVIARTGRTIDRVLRAGDTEQALPPTSWTLRAIAYRRAWLYYANQPVTPVAGEACPANAVHEPVPAASPPPLLIFP